MDVESNEKLYVLTKQDRVFVCCLILIGIGLVFGLKIQKFGARTLEMQIGQKDAVIIANTLHKPLEIDLDGYDKVVWFRDWLDSPHFAHLVRNIPLARADTLASEKGNPWMWYVRWFKPLEEEELVIGVDGFGRLRKLEHIIPEDRAGALLNESEARVLAESFLDQYFGRVVANTSNFRLKESRQVKRQARYDYQFVWENLSELEDGIFLIDVTVQGDKVGFVRHRYTAPEAFLRSIRMQDIKDLIGPLLFVIWGLATVALAVRYFIIYVRNNQVIWRPAIIVGLSITCFMVLEGFNRYPDIFKDYPTNQTIEVYWVTYVIGVLIGASFLGGIAIVGLVLFDIFFKQVFSRELTLQQWFVMVKDNQANYKVWLDAILLGLAMVLIFLGGKQFYIFAEYTWLQAYLRPNKISPDGLNSVVPLFTFVADAISGTVGLLLIGCAILVWQKAIQSAWIFYVFALVGVFTGALMIFEDGFQFGVVAMLWAFVLFFLMLLIVTFVKFHFLGYVTAVWFSIFLGGGIGLLEFSSDIYGVDGYGLVGVGLLPAFVLLYSWGRAIIVPDKLGE